MKKTFLLLGFLAIFALTNTSAKALAMAADYYDFAFSIDGGDGQIISGEILGLENNATSVPYDIVINSDPFNPEVGSGNYSLYDNGYDLSPYMEDTFTVADGIITGTGPGDGDTGTGLEAYKVLNNEPYSQIAYNFNSFGSANGEGTSGTDIPTNFHGNDDGFSGTTYEPGTISAVPEPSQWGWAVFLFGAGVVLWRRSFRLA